MLILRTQPVFNGHINGVTIRNAVMLLLAAN